MDRKPKRIPRSVYTRYILMNIPGLAAFMLILWMVRHWFPFPGSIFWILVACWAIKDAVMFPFVWKAYDPHAPVTAGTLIGEGGVVKRRIDPAGYIQVRGELWRAQRADDGPPIEMGRKVRISDRQGLTLYVRPED